MELADGESAKELRGFDSRIAGYGWLRFIGTKLMGSEKGIQVEIAVPGISYEEGIY